MSVKDGGPAFPGQCRCEGHAVFVAKDGMSLRQWYAGQALIGILTNPAVHIIKGTVGVSSPQEAAMAAVAYADALLTVLESP